MGDVHARLDKARDMCAGVLAKDAANVEALLVMALLHEPCCLNQPDKAMEYYAKLAAMKDNPPAVLAGLSHQCRLQAEAGRFAQARELLKTLQARFPRNSNEEAFTRLAAWLDEKIKGSDR